MVDAAKDTTCKVMVVGLQGCGKTTFAAALWHLVSSDEVEDLAMKIGKHSGNFAYLDRIARLWADGYRVGRTEYEAEDKVEIDLVDASTGRGCVLSFTDMAGERFEETFATRACPMSVIERIDEADGLLLFVSAWRRPTDGTILKAIADVPGLAPSPADVAKAPPVSNWKPADTPPEAILVDLLDAFTRPPFERCPKRLAVVVSAWDLVCAGSGGNGVPAPEAWLNTTYPLLRQYLSASEHDYDVRCYGISAQGADAPEQRDGPDDPRRKKLLKHAKPSERIAVVGSGAGPHDLTAPLKWLSTGGD